MQLVFAMLEVREALGEAAPPPRADAKCAQRAGRADEMNCDDCRAEK